MSIKSIIEDAKKILLERGFATGDLVDSEGGPCCIVGALGLAAGVSEQDLLKGDYTEFRSGGIAGEVVAAVALHIDPDSDWEWEPNYSDLYTFNDSNNEEAVHDLLDRAIEDL